MNLFRQLVGLLGGGISPTHGLYPHTGQHNTQKHGNKSMSRVKFEPTIPVFERPKTVRASDRAAIGAGVFIIIQAIFLTNCCYFQRTRNFRKLEFRVPTALLTNYSRNGSFQMPHVLFTMKTARCQNANNLLLKQRGTKTPITSYYENSEMPKHQ
jgi:hypothetical protein